MVMARFWSLGRRAAVAAYLLGLSGFVASTGAMAAGSVSLSADNADSIAIVIGNKTYRQTVAVDFADNDAKAMHDYLVKGLGFREANIITLPDATRNDLEYELGTDQSPQGDLYNRVHAGRSHVFVYYSGHGVPDVATGRSFLLPSDGYPNSSGSGYALETLYRNLEVVKQKVGANRQVIVMIDACFTGETGRKGQKLLEVSAPGFVPTRPKSGSSLIKLLASSGTTPANWDDVDHLGLFTSRFLLGVGGLAAPGASGPLPWSRLRQYVIENVEETARVEDQRKQVPEIDEAALTLPTTPPVAAVSNAIALIRDEAAWHDAQAKDTREAYEAYIGNCDPNDPCAHKQDALALLNDVAEKALRDADKQNWERLSKDQKYQAYLDGCTANHPCAYHDIAEQYLKLTKAQDTSATNFIDNSGKSNVALNSKLHVTSAYEAPPGFILQPPPTIAKLREWTETTPAGSDTGFGWPVLSFFSGHVLYNRGMMPLTRSMFMVAINPAATSRSPHHDP